MPITKRLKKTEKEQVESSSSSDEEDSMNSSNEDSASENNEEEIMIDFEARSIEESDLDFIKHLIQQKLGSFSLNVNETAKIIVQQDNIGNVIYQSTGNDENEEEEKKTTDENNTNDDNTIFGVLSLINLNSTQCKSYTSAFKTFILKESQKADKKSNTNMTEKINEILREKRCAYVVNERFVNIPPAISVPMLESLLKDIDAAKDNENNFNFDYWIFLSKYFENCEETAETTGTATSLDSSLIYSNAEEEIFEQLSEYKFEISAGKSNKDGQLTSFVNCLILPFNQVNECIEKIKTLI